MSEKKEKIYFENWIYFWSTKKPPVNLICFYKDNTLTSFLLPHLFFEIIVVLELNALNSYLRYIPIIA